MKEGSHIKPVCAAIGGIPLLHYTLTHSLPHYTRSLHCRDDKGSGWLSVRCRAMIGRLA
mgnify:CR=1 FL=1